MKETPKETLMKIFDADIAAASGYDKKDLEVVRAWIARTPDAPTEKDFLAAMKKDQTLAERDAYIRAIEWKRATKQTR